MLVQELESVKLLAGQDDILAGRCPLTGRYFGPWARCTKRTAAHAQQVLERQNRAKGKKKGSASMVLKGNKWATQRNWISPVQVSPELNSVSRPEKGIELNQY